MGVRSIACACVLVLGGAFSFGSSWTASPIAADGRRVLYAEDALPSPSAEPPSPSPTVAPAVPPPVPPHARSALLIGINHAKGSPTLRGAVGDANALREALLAYGFPLERITVLTEGDATRANILAALDRLAASAAEDGRAVFAFAGHTRRSGGTNRIVASDGRTITAAEIAERLGRVRSPLWVALPTCYAGGFAIPGIVGPNRVATFASAADTVAWEDALKGRSFLFQAMVSEAMLGGFASASVERAFAYAEDRLRRDHPDKLPLIDDRYPGEFVLGAPIPRVSRADPNGRQQAPSSTPTPRPDGREDQGMDICETVGFGLCTSRRSS